VVLEQLFELMAEKKASDLLLSAGSPITIKIQGVLLAVNQSQILQSDDIIRLVAEVISEEELSRLMVESDLNLGVKRPGIGSFRLSAFRQKGNISAVFRYIPVEPPSLAKLNIPEFVGNLIDEPRGLILICGATGSGKSTTIASMIQKRNNTRMGHILTVEDPIEFHLESKKSLINQREVGVDAPSLEIALKNALRQTPDLIFIGEIRDRATMTAAITYALSGHLVISTLHANNSYHALSRIVSMYPAEGRETLLSDLSVSLKSVVTQRLVKAIKGGRLPAVEIMVNTQLTAHLIEHGRLSELKEAMNKSLTKGSQTFEHHLMAYVNEGLISLDDALYNADSPTNLMWLINNQGMSKPSETVTQAPIDRTASGAQYKEFNFG
jgi:twitching motility protein PilU